MYLSGFQNAAGKREKEKGRERKGEERREGGRQKERLE